MGALSWQNFSSEVCSFVFEVTREAAERQHNEMPIVYKITVGAASAAASVAASAAALRLQAVGRGRAVRAVLLDHARAAARL